MLCLAHLPPFSHPCMHTSQIPPQIPSFLPSSLLSAPTEPTAAVAFRARCISSAQRLQLLYRWHTHVPTTPYASRLRPPIHSIGLMSPLYTCADRHTLHVSEISPAPSRCLFCSSSIFWQPVQTSVAISLNPAMSQPILTPSLSRIIRHWLQINHILLSLELNGIALLLQHFTNQFFLVSCHSTDLNWQAQYSQVAISTISLILEYE